MVAEKFQTYSVKVIVQIHLFFKSKNWICSILLIAQAKLSYIFLSLFPRQAGIAHSSRTAFSEDIFSWAEREGEDYGVEKVTKINKCIGYKF